MAIPRLSDVGVEELIRLRGMTITPALNGFLKGLAIVIVTAATAFLADANNVAPIIGNSAALLVAAIASSMESHIRSHTGKGLMGVARVR